MWSLNLNVFNVWKYTFRQIFFKKNKKAYGLNSSASNYQKVEVTFTEPLIVSLQKKKSYFLPCFCLVFSAKIYKSRCIYLRIKWHKIQSCFLRNWLKLSNSVIKAKTNICQLSQKNKLNSKGRQVSILHWQIFVLSACNI